MNAVTIESTIPTTQTAARELYAAAMATGDSWQLAGASLAAVVNESVRDGWTLLITPKQPGDVAVITWQYDRCVLIDENLVACGCDL